MDPTANLFEKIPAQMPAELTDTLLAAKNVRVERIVSRGQKSAPDFWYDQDHGEWVLVLEGAARLQFENEIVQLHRGDHINIPAHQRHRVEWTDPNQATVWLAIHYY